MGMVTALETDSPLLCFQTDRFKPDHRGKVTKAAWHLDVTTVEILISPDQDSLITEAHEYIPIAGIVHRGQDLRGHLQCVGRTTRGWLLFEDGVEPVLHPSSRPPRPSDWICVWLLRTPRCRNAQPSYYIHDHAAKVHQLVKLLDPRRWQDLEAREDLMRHFATHCGACGQIYLDTSTLAKHVYQRHSQMR